MEVDFGQEGTEKLIISNERERLDYILLVTAGCVVVFSKSGLHKQLQIIVCILLVVKVGQSGRIIILLNWSNNRCV